MTLPIKNWLASFLIWYQQLVKAKKASIQTACCNDDEKTILTLTGEAFDQLYLTLYPVEIVRQGPDRRPLLSPIDELGSLLFYLSERVISNFWCDTN